MNIKKYLFIFLLYSVSLNNSYSMGADVFVQSTVNRASSILSEDTTRDQKIIELLEEVPTDDLDLIAELLVSGVRLGLEDVNRGELKLTNSALKELRHSFSVFAPYRSERKATLFGSARIAAGDPAYISAREFGAAMAERGWMVMTGAGPGIMAAGLEGAGTDRSFGINITLPFESSANEFIADDPKLINFKYFFTRKVIFMKETHG